MKRTYRLELLVGGIKKYEKKRWNSVNSIINHIADYNRRIDYSNFKSNPIEEYKIFDGYNQVVHGKISIG